jgi:uncharacterized membrane protein
MVLGDRAFLRPFRAIVRRGLTAILRVFLTFGRGHMKIWLIHQDIHV